LNWIVALLSAVVGIAFSARGKKRFSKLVRLSLLVSKPKKEALFSKLPDTFETRFCIFSIPGILAKTFPFP
jgi:hypothetical protein